MTDKTAIEIVSRIKAIYSYAFKDLGEKGFRLLVSSWKSCLENYDDETVNAALKIALQRCKTPPTIADITEIIKECIECTDKSDGELWNEYLHLIYSASDLSSKFHYTAIENGKTQGERAREELKALFDGADYRIKDFIGSVGNLVELSKTEDLSYERARFYKGIKNSRKRVQAKRELLPVLGSFEIKKIDG